MMSMTFDHYTIRIATLEDLQDYFELIERNRSRLEDFFAGTVAVTKTLDETHSHLKDVIGKWEKKEYYPFLVIDNTTNKPIASIQVKSMDISIPKAELGYYVDAAYEQQKIISRAISMIIDYCFAEVKLHKLFIRTHYSNIPSIRIAENNLFKLEGILRSEYKTTLGEIVDIHYYGLLAYERHVVHETNNTKGAFKYVPGASPLAEMTYSLTTPSLMIIDHTEVDESLQGQGVGKKLQQNLVDYVRAKGIKVIPVCPFAKAQFARMKNWQDVLK